MPKFTPKQKFTKENISKVPDNKALVYKIENSTGKNLYTGIAGRGRGQERLYEHKDLPREKVPGGTKFQFVQVKNKERAKQVEKQIIRQEQPKFNEQGK
ncbi:MAG TPA: GIY-YIG nuclease family protein [Candidatus Paceibacterota bacterium]